MTMGNPGRRNTDHPDWKMAAPRWVLVGAVVIFGGVTLNSAHGYMDRLDETVSTVDGIVRQQAQQGQAIEGLQDQVAMGRIDMLRFQVYTVKRQGNSELLEDLSQRLRDAEQARSRDVRRRGLPR